MSDILLDISFLYPIRLPDIRYMLEFGILYLYLIYSLVLLVVMPQCLPQYQLSTQQLSILARKWEVGTLENADFGRK